MLKIILQFSVRNKVFTLLNTYSDDIRADLAMGTFDPVASGNDMTCTEGAWEVYFAQMHKFGILCNSDLY